MVPTRLHAHTLKHPHAQMPTRPSRLITPTQLADCIQTGFSPTHARGHEEGCSGKDEFDHWGVCEVKIPQLIVNWIDKTLLEFGTKKLTWFDT